MTRKTSAFTRYWTRQGATERRAYTCSHARIFCVMPEFSLLVASVKERSRAETGRIAESLVQVRDGDRPRRDSPSLRCMARPPCGRVSRAVWSVASSARSRSNGLDDRTLALRQRPGSGVLRAVNDLATRAGGAWTAPDGSRSISLMSRDVLHAVFAVSGTSKAALSVSSTCRGTVSLSFSWQRLVNSAAPVRVLLRPVPTVSQPSRGVLQ